MSRKIQGEELKRSGSETLCYPEPYLVSIPHCESHIGAGGSQPAQETCCSEPFQCATDEAKHLVLIYREFYFLLSKNSLDNPEIFLQLGCKVFKLREEFSW